MPPISAFGPASVPAIVPAPLGPKSGDELFLRGCKVSTNRQSRPPAFLRQSVMDHCAIIAYKCWCRCGCALVHHACYASHSVALHARLCNKKLHMRLSAMHSVPHDATCNLSVCYVCIPNSERAWVRAVRSNTAPLTFAYLQLSGDASARQVMPITA